MNKVMFSIDLESMVKNEIMNIPMSISISLRISVCVCVCNDLETISCCYNEISACDIK